jgi:hypothetical protein
MYFALMDGYDAVLGFMDRGGGLLWVIATLLLVKFSLVFERVWYLHSTHMPRRSNRLWQRGMAGPTKTPGEPDRSA